MSRPPKPISVIEFEGRSHRTKSEKNQRRQAESDLLTGEELKESEETKRNKRAHKEFLRLKKLLQKIGKFDDLYGSIINRYCIMKAECTEFEEKRERFYGQLCEFQGKMDELVDKEEMSWKEAFRMEDSLQRNVIGLDKQVQTKRKMLLDIEKESVLTIASSLRSIPKKVETKRNALLDALAD